LFIVSLCLFADEIGYRCGTEVRYIIDFYSGAQPANNSGQVSMFMDVRPALDNWGAVVDRARMQFRDVFRMPSFGSSDK